MLDVNCRQNTNKLKLCPSQKLINKWKASIAIEMIEYLKGTEIKDVNKNNWKVPDFENGQKFKSLHQKLNQEAALLKRNVKSSEDLKIAKRNLELYYENNVVAELRNISEEDDFFINFRTNLDSTLKFNKPEIARLILHKNSVNLKHHKNSIRKLRRELTREETQAFTDYERIKESFKIEFIDTAWKKIVLAINLSLSIAEKELIEESCLQAAMLCSIHQSTVSSSLAILTNIEKSFEPDLIDETISLPISFYMGSKKLLKEQEKKLMDWIGYSINYWHQSPYREEEIKQKLLENLELPVRNIFDNFVSDYIEIELAET